MMFEANEENASIHVKTTKRYPELQTFSSLKLIYEQNKNTEMRLVCNASADTLQRDASRHIDRNPIRVGRDVHRSGFHF